MVFFGQPAQISDDEIAREFVRRLEAAGFGGGDPTVLAAKGADPWAAFEKGRGRFHVLAPKK